MDPKINKKRFFEYGFKVGFLKSGPFHSIADVEGVTVGHITKIEGRETRTGVTVIDPGTPNLFKNKIPAAFYAGNGTGKVVGALQIEELGILETPIVLTTTLSVGTVMQGMVNLIISKEELEKEQSINTFVGECNDAILNNIHKNSISENDVRIAYEKRKKEFEIGNVGAGTGTRAFSWKGGIGTSSRLITLNGKEYTVGALVQTNYGGALEILGVPIGKLLSKTDYGEIFPDTDGSCMMILATDAPMTSRQLRRLAKRAFMGLAKTGTVMRTASGDFALAFTTSRAGLEGSGVVGECLADAALNGPFLAAAEAVEEAVYDAIFAAETMEGRDGNTLEAIPKERVVQLLTEYRKK